jgi:AcrR family transcriptional regulator
LARNVETDGRTLRGERNRQALMDAAMELTNEGNLTPTAQEIAQRAGVGLRGVFRHFGDMEGLIAALDERLRKSGVARFAGGNRQGSLRERILHAIEQHALGYEENRNIFLAAQSQRWRSAVTRQNYARANTQLRTDLEDWLPELKTLSIQRREAVDAAASFEMWNRLREHQHNDVEAAIDILYDMIKALITAP